MRVAHRIADLPENPQPLFEIGLLLPDPFGQWNALDELHDDIRLPALCLPAVEQPRDVGVAEACQ